MLNKYEEDDNDQQEDTECSRGQCNKEEPEGTVYIFRLPYMELHKMFKRQMRIQDLSTRQCTGIAGIAGIAGISIVKSHNPSKI